MTPIARSPGERAGAWLVTGPPGHLWSTLADVSVAWARWAFARLRGKPPLS